MGTLWVLIAFFLLVSVAFPQEYVPPVVCSEQEPRYCVERCACAYCTQNTTVAQMLVNGTMTPEGLYKSGDNGTCVDRAGRCPKGYQQVQSADAIVAGGGTCSYLVILVVVLGVAAAVAALVGVYALVHSCQCCETRKRRERGDQMYDHL